MLLAEGVQFDDDDEDDDELTLVFNQFHSELF